MDFATYSEINNGFSKTVKFRLTNRGFYSEVCCLLGAANFCLQKKLRLLVDETDFSGFSWSDFFLDGGPVWNQSKHGTVEELTVSRSHKYNRRLNRFRVPVWDRYSQRLQSVFEMQVQLAHILCVPRTREVFSTEPYIGVQLRRGDKTKGYELNGKLKIESKESPIGAYVTALRKNSNGIKKVFVLTDDFQAFDALRAAAPEFEYHTFCRPDELGYVNETFQSLDLESKRTKLIDLVKSVDICGRSSFFIGPFQSNPSKFVLLAQGTRRLSQSTDANRRWKP